MTPNSDPKYVLSAKAETLLTAIDLKAARAPQRVARPTARRPQPTLRAAIRRGCRVTACIASGSGQTNALP